MIPKSGHRFSEKIMLTIVYFGWTFGFPPGDPGGGMTFIAPPSGGGWCICGSTPAGGQITPLDWAS
jgi:hypothetical protein